MRSLCRLLVFAVAILITAGCGATVTEKPLPNTTAEELEEAASPSLSTPQSDRASLDTLVGYRWNGAQEEIISIDPTTGSTSIVATLDLDVVVAGGAFAVDSDNHKAYLQGRREEESFWRLYTTDLITGEVSSIPLSGVVALSGFDLYNKDTLIGYTWSGAWPGGQEEMVLIDPTTGSTSIVATLDLDVVVAGGAFAVDSDNHKAYLQGRREEESFWRLYTTDLITGEVSSVPLAVHVSGFDLYVAQRLIVVITKARMVSKHELGVDLKVTVPKSDPKEGPWKVRFTAEINGQLFTTRDFDLTDLLEAGDTDKEIRFDEGDDPRKINLEEYGVPRFTENQKFTLTAIFSSPNSQGTGDKEVKILLPVIIVHGWTGESLFASIPFRIYEDLISRLRTEGYTNDPSWYKTIWFERYSSQTWSPWYVAYWLDGMAEKAISATYAKRVNIIGHSLGGLVGRYYITNGAGKSKVHKLIMVGTPNGGSSQFYINTSGWNINKVNKELATSPLAQWLIPTYQALYDTMNNPLSPPIRNNFPDQSSPQGVTYYSIYNIAINTPYGLIVKPRSGWYVIVDKDYYQSGGDGTVSSESARLDGAINSPLVVSNGHAFLPKDPIVQNTIIEHLKD